MQFSKRWMSYLILGVYIGLSGYISVSAYSQSKEYSVAAHRLAEAQDISHQIALASERLLDAVTFGYTEEYEKSLDQLQSSKASQNKLKVDLENQFFLFLAGSLIALSLTLIVKPRGATLAWTLFILSITALFLGVTSPLLSITTTANIAPLGEIVIQYSIKGVFDSISNSFLYGQYLIGVLILLFSIVIPALKTLLSVFVLARPHLNMLEKYHNIAASIGKWSMADVYIVAVIVSSFGLSVDEMTSSSTEIGFFYFSTYVVSSMVLSQLLKSRIRTISH